MTVMAMVMTIAIAAVTIIVPVVVPLATPVIGVVVAKAVIIAVGIAAIVIVAAAIISAGELQCSVALRDIADGGCSRRNARRGCRRDGGSAHDQQGESKDEFLQCRLLCLTGRGLRMVIIHARLDFGFNPGVRVTHLKLI